MYLNYRVSLCALALLAEGCDNASPQTHYSPEMASFANEFDFDPLSGPVKSFTQTVLTSAGIAERRVIARLSRQGCFESLALENYGDETQAILVLDGNFYRDAHDNEPRIRTQGTCQLGAIPATGLTYTTDNADYVVGASAPEVEIAYQYDKDGFPFGRTVRHEQDTVIIHSKPLKNAQGKLDYQSRQSLNGIIVTEATQRCQYDNYLNPQSCELTITPLNKPATRYTIENSIDYY